MFRLCIRLRHVELGCQRLLCDRIGDFQDRYESDGHPHWYYLYDSGIYDADGDTDCGGYCGEHLRGGGTAGREMELFAASFLMIGGLFLMTGRVAGGSMRLMVRLSVNRG